MDTLVLMPAAFYRNMTADHPTIKEVLTTVASAANLESRQGRFTAAVNLTSAQCDNVKAILTLLNGRGFTTALIGDNTLAVSWA